MQCRNSDRFRYMTNAKTTSDVPAWIEQETGHGLTGHMKLLSK